MRRLAKKNNKKGFTLVEIVITIAIVVVLMSFLAPAFLNYVEDSRMKRDEDAMNNVVSSIENALANRSAFEEAYFYAITGNVSCYIDDTAENHVDEFKINVPDGSTASPNAQYYFLDEARRHDEMVYNAAGNMRGLTITFRPENKKWDLSKGVINQFVRPGTLTPCATRVASDRTADAAKHINMGGIAPNYEKREAFSVMRKGNNKEHKLYEAVTDAVGKEIEISSRTYRNSEFTVFITLNDTVSVTGQFNGTNIPGTFKYDEVVIPGNADVDDDLPPMDIGDGNPEYGGGGENGDVVLPTDPADPDKEDVVPDATDPENKPDPDDDGKGGGDIGQGGDPIDPSKPNVPNLPTIPNGCVYYIGLTNNTPGDYSGATAVLNEGDPFPTVVQDGDVFVSYDYEYRYGKQIKITEDPTAFVPITLTWERLEPGHDGWGVRVKRTTKPSYEDVYNSINKKDVVSLSGAFYQCEMMRTLPKMPNGIYNMNSAFEKCTVLVNPTKWNMPDSVVTAEKMFKDCGRLQLAPRLSKKIKTLNSAFMNCNELRQAPVLNNGVEDISNLFNGCNSLIMAQDNMASNGDFKNYTIPTSVIKMENAFKNCKELKIGPDANHFKGPNANGTVVTKGSGNAAGVFEGCVSLEQATIPNGWSNVNNVFKNCRKLTTIKNFTNSAQYMDYAFYNCENLVNVPAPSTITETMDYTYYSCKNMVNAPAIQNRVRSMNGTFFGCDSMKNGPASIPSSVSAMNQTFKNCSRAVNLPDPPKNGYVKELKETYMNCAANRRVINVPDGVVDMTSTFEGCTSMGYDNDNSKNGFAPALPRSVRNLDKTFKRCFSIIHAPTIPENVESMFETFKYCYKMSGDVIVNAKSNVVRNCNAAFAICAQAGHQHSGNPNGIFCKPGTVHRLNIRTTGSTNNIEIRKRLRDSYEDNREIIKCPAEIYAVGDSAQPQPPKIPNGAQYYSNVTTSNLGDYSGGKLTNGGNKYPELKDGDVMVYNNYEYRYNRVYRMDKNGNNGSWTRASGNGWGVKVIDTNASSFAQIENDVNKYVVRFMDYTYANCVNASSTKNIPTEVVSMVGTYLNCKKLNAIPTIPDTVTNIEQMCRGCSALSKEPQIEIGSLMDNMNQAFQDCTSLKSMPIIPEHVHTMMYAFDGCINLTNTTPLPVQVRELQGAFRKCTSLQQVDDMPEGVRNIKEMFAESGIVYAPRIPDTVEDMEKTFYKCANLIDVPVLGKNVVNLKQTFEGCEKMGEQATRAMEIPSTVRFMTRAFRNCKSLKQVGDIPGVEDLTETFSGCTNLKSVGTIGEGAKIMIATFYQSGIEEIQKLPETVTTMIGTFEDCKSLKHVHSIPSLVGDMTYTFKGCSSLEEAPKIPYQVRTMLYTFKDCTSMTLLPPVIPETVNIAQGTFMNCSAASGHIDVRSEVFLPSTDPRDPSKYYAGNEEFLSGCALDENHTIYLEGTPKNLQLRENLKAKSALTSPDFVIIPDLTGLPENPTGSLLDKTAFRKACENVTGSITFKSIAQIPTDAMGIDISENKDGSVRVKIDGQDAIVYGQGGIWAPVDSSSMFEQFQAKYLYLGGLRTDKTTNMSNMFARSAFNSIIIDEWITDNVTNMSGMFENSMATEINIYGINTLNVTTMRSMFKNTSVQELTLENIITEQVVDMQEMFRNCAAKTLYLMYFKINDNTITTDMFAEAKANKVYCRSEKDKQLMASSKGNIIPENSFVVN